MKKLNLMERMVAKRGSVLFIVLVIMSFLVIIASAVFYTVSASRQNVVMEYSDVQAFQTANDLLEIIHLSLTQEGSHGNGQELAAAMLALKVNCDGQSPCSTCAPMGAMETWLVNGLIGQNFRDVMGNFTLGTHYIVTQAPREIPGGGIAEVIIYVNSRGDIVVEVSVEYNGRTATAQRIYDSDTVASIFRPRWVSLTSSDGKGLGWIWRSGRSDQPLPGNGTAGFEYGVVGVFPQLLNRADSRVNVREGDFVLQLEMPFRIDANWWLWTGPGNPNEATHYYRHTFNENNNTVTWDTGIARTAWITAREAEVVQPTPGSPLPRREFRWVQITADDPRLWHNNNSTSTPWLKVGDWLGIVDPAGTLIPAPTPPCLPPGRDSAHPNGACFRYVPGTPPTFCNFGTINPSQGNCPHPWTCECDECLRRFGRPGDPPCNSCTRLWSVCGGSCAPCLGPGPHWRGGVANSLNGAILQSSTPPAAAQTINGTVRTNLAQLCQDRCVRCTNCNEVWLTCNGGCVSAGSRCTTLQRSGVAGCGQLFSVCGGDCAPCNRCHRTWAQCRRSDGTNLCDPPPGQTSGPPLTDDGRIEGPMWVNDQGQPVAPTDPGAINVQGASPYAGPNGNTWFQRSAFHTSGKAAGNVDHLRIRGVAATVHFDTTWAVLQCGPSRGPFRSDISANHNLVIGDVSISNPAVFNRTQQITVGNDLFFGTGGASGISVSGDNGNINSEGSGSRGATNYGPINFFVGGNMTANGQNASNYGDSRTTYYVIGNVHLLRGTNAWSTSDSPTIRISPTSRVFDNSGNDITTSILNNANVRIQRMAGSDLANTEREINFLLGDVPTNITWNVVAPPSDRNLSVTFGSGKADDWGSSTNADNPLTNTYGLAINDTARQRIFYINRCATITTNNISSGTDQNAAWMVIIDTGLEGSTTNPARTVNLRLDRGTASEFRWSGNSGQTTRIAVLSIGDGDVVMEVPSASQYRTGQGSCVMPFNMAVGRTGNDWYNCSRLSELSRGSNVRGCDTFHTQRSQCSGSRAGWGSWGCWMHNLLELNGSGRVRTSFVAADEVHARNQQYPLNMNIWLVYNGTSTNGIRIESEQFHAVNIYAPNMVFTVDDNANNAVANFGSIFASQLNMRSQMFFIAVLPGGGLGSGTIPASRGPVSQQGDDRVAGPGTGGSGPAGPDIPGNRPDVGPPPADVPDGGQVPGVNPDGSPNSAKNESGTNTLGDIKEDDGIKQNL